jgi:hypothetical protein
MQERTQHWEMESREHQYLHLHAVVQETAKVTDHCSLALALLTQQVGPTLEVRRGKVIGFGSGWAALSGEP